MPNTGSSSGFPSMVRITNKQNLMGMLNQPWMARCKRAAWTFKSAGMDKKSG